MGGRGSSAFGFASLEGRPTLSVPTPSSASRGPASAPSWLWLLPAVPSASATIIPASFQLLLALPIRRSPPVLASDFHSASAGSRQPCFRPREVLPRPSPASVISLRPRSFGLGHLASVILPWPSPASAISLWPRSFGLGHLASVIPPRPYPASVISLWPRSFGLGHLALVIPPRPSSASASTFHSREEGSEGTTSKLDIPRFPFKEEREKVVGHTSFSFSLSRGPISSYSKLQSIPADSSSIVRPPLPSPQGSSLLSGSSWRSCFQL